MADPFAKTQSIEREKNVISADNYQHFERYCRDLGLSADDSIFVDKGDWLQGNPRPAIIGLTVSDRSKIIGYFTDAEVAYLLAPADQKPDVPVAAETKPLIEPLELPDEVPVVPAPEPVTVSQSMVVEQEPREPLIERLPEVQTGEPTTDAGASTAATAEEPAPKPPKRKSK